jgi:hypothetical protein
VESLPVEPTNSKQKHVQQLDKKDFRGLIPFFELIGNNLGGRLFGSNLKEDHREDNMRDKDEKKDDV